MAVKTINLTGAEVAVTGLDGAHAHIRNDGTEVIYAAKSAGITAGADGVASIPAGQSDTIRGISGAVYLLGTGSVLIQSDDYVTSPFKTSAQAGGSGADEIARAAISAHSGNADIHVTAEDKAKWNAVNYSNPNLLINPDFKINQRGQDSYTVTGHTADCWFSQKLFTVTPLESGIRIEPVEAVTTNSFGLYQQIPVSKAMYGNDFTLTTKVATTNDYAYAVIYAYNSADSVIKSSDKIKLQTGLNSVTINNLPDTTSYIRIQFTFNSGAQTSDILEVEWTKLELGSIATPFVPPDTATELTKCQRFYQIRSTNDIAAVDLRPSMATIKDIKLREDGNYEYIAEL